VSENVEPVGDGTRRIAHAAVEATLRELGALPLRPQADSMLRVLLAYRAMWRGQDAAAFEPRGPTVKDVVEELFQLLPGPPEFPGTISLRSSQGKPSWLKNGSWLGSWVDYAGPTSPGRRLFEDEDWHKPMAGDAVDVVAETLGRGNRWPPRDVLAAIVLRNADLDPATTWDELIERARARFDLTADEFEKVTSPPAVGAVELLGGEEWDPNNLAADLRPASADTVRKAEQTVEDLPPRLAEQVKRVLDALRRHGETAIVALAGVPGTSKSHVARIAARAYASEGALREIQLSPGYSYEEFMEGPRFTEGGVVAVVPGAFLELNDRALQSPDKQYVLLIEELTRADLPKVLGELLTYVEYRGDEDEFTTMYRRETTTRVAPNLAVLATYNPSDRSAVNLDAAIIRRLRVLSFPPSVDLLREILTGNGVDPAVIGQLAEMFEVCRERATPDRFEEVMPFGHALFSWVTSERDLHDLWHEELRHLLVRPRAPQHELYETIRDHYPWHASPEYTVVAHAAGEGDALTVGEGAAERGGAESVEGADAGPAAESG
jgi:MoxR-like ATPase